MQYALIYVSDIFKNLILSTPLLQMTCGQKDGYNFLQCLDQINQENLLLILTWLALQCVNE